MFPVCTPAAAADALARAAEPQAVGRPTTAVSRLVDSAAAFRCVRTCRGGRSSASSGEVQGLLYERSFLRRGGPGDSISVGLRSRCNRSDLVAQLVASTDLSRKRRRPSDYRPIRPGADSSRYQARRPTPDLHESQSCRPSRIGWRPVREPVIATSHSLALPLGPSRRRFGPRSTDRSTCQRKASGIQHFHRVDGG